MMTATGVIQESAEARSGLYALLCLATARPEDWQVDWLQRRLRRLARVLSDRVAFPGLRSGILDLGQALRQAPLQDLAVEHGRLERLAPPYESHYRDPDGLLMGEAAGAVIRLYREAGLAPDAGWQDLPDHLWAELECMAHLTEQEAACWQRDLLPLADRWLALQERFLRSHLTRWIPAYADRVRGAEPLLYYGRLAGLLAEIAGLDLQWVAGLRGQLAAGLRDQWAALQAGADREEAAGLVREG